MLAAAVGLGAAAAGVAGLREAIRRGPVPPRTEFLATAGLSAPVDVLIDRAGVSHVYARTARDLLFAQGYLHARDRRWQMELNARIAMGTLAELFGAQAIDADRFLRRLGFARDARRDHEQLGEESRTLLASYAAGVNAYVEHHRRPLEFTLLRTRPRPWQPVDSLAFGRYMSWSQTSNFETELIRSRLLAELPPDRVAALEAGDPAPAVTGGGPKARDVHEATREAAGVKSPISGLRGGASNNWVVSGAHSRSGQPLLANDPHLFPRIPPVWYVMHLNGDGFDVAGASLPGVPGIIIGHNARVAWGVTAGMTDGEDLFVERSDPANPSRFLFDGRSEEPTRIHEVIAVRSRREPIEEDIVVTRHGPILNGTLGIPADAAPLALRSVLHDAASPVESILRLNRASDATTFREALRDWAFPCLNFVYADVDGTIGYQLAGHVPVRTRGDGYAPVPGWTGEYEWTGTVPFDELPHTENPADGMYATANTRPAAPSNHFLARDWIDDGRWRRILECLRARDRHSLDDFARMQVDVVSLPARAIVHRLDAETWDDPLVHKAAAYVKVWNGMLAQESVAAAIYEVFRSELIRTLNSDLTTEQLALVQGRGVDPLIAPVSAFWFRGSSELLGRLEHADQSSVRRAFISAVERLRLELGDDLDRWQWGRLHRMTFAHPIGVGVPALDRAFRLSRGPVPVGGDADTVAQAGVDPWHPFDANAFMPSYRQLFDLADWDAARFILPTGQSGHPGSPHYDDMLDAWRKGEYRPLPFSRAAVEASVAETIALVPD